MDLLELLAAGDVAGFNAARSPRNPPDLFAADLAAARLPGVDLSRANLEKADLTEATLVDALLAAARLDDADMDGVDLSRAVLVKARLRGSRLEGATLNGADLSGADLTEAVLVEVRAEDLKAGSARLRRAELRGAWLSGARLEGADMEGTDCGGATLRDGRLGEANLTGARFVGAVLAGADLSGTRAAGADFTRADLQGASFVGADLRGAVFRGADLRGADFTRADLSGADIEGAVVVGARFNEARLVGVELAEEQADGATSAPASSAVMEPVTPHMVTFEDLTPALGHGGLAVLFEAVDVPLPLRLLMVGPGGRLPGEVAVLPASAELLRARGLVATEDGFLAMAFTELTTGWVLSVTELSPLGDLGHTLQVPLEYRPAASPVLVGEDAGFLLFGLAAGGPTLFVHRYENGALTRLFGARLPTARGFVDGGAPVLLTKGGTLVVVGPEGPGPAHMAPEAFPSRLGGAVPCAGGLLAAWVVDGEKGFRWAQLDAQRRLAGERLVPAARVAGLSIGTVGEQVLVAFALEQGIADPVTAWACWLPDGAPFRLLSEGEDVDQVHVLGADPESGQATVLVVTLDEHLHILRLQGSRVVAARVVQ